MSQTGELLIKNSHHQDMASDFYIGNRQIVSSSVD